MQGLKKFTRAITMILVGLIIVLTGCLLAVLMKVAGLIALVDSLWGAQISFYIALLASRWVFAAIWGLIDYFVISRLHKWEWFWFKPEPPRHRYGEKSVDKSGEILEALVVIAFVILFSFLIAEGTIRLVSWTEPFYLL